MAWPNAPKISRDGISSRTIARQMCVLLDQGVKWTGLDGHPWPRTVSISMTSLDLSCGLDFISERFLQPCAKHILQHNKWHLLPDVTALGATEKFYGWEVSVYRTYHLGGLGLHQFTFSVSRETKGAASSFELQADGIY